MSAPPFEPADTDAKVDPWPRLPVAAALASVAGTTTALGGAALTEDANMIAQVAPITDGFAPAAQAVLTTHHSLLDSLLLTVGTIASIGGLLTAVVGAGVGLYALFQQLSIVRTRSKWSVGRYGR